jgi:hypothetical protein
LVLLRISTLRLGFNSTTLFDAELTVDQSFQPDSTAKANCGVRQAGKPDLRRYLLEISLAGG